MLSPYLLALAFLAPVLAQEQFVQWTPCTAFPFPFQCANFSVPLDYGDTTKGTITLALIRHPAPFQPVQGTLFLNPGGPGGSGVQFVGNGVPLIRRSIGDDWDIVSWDPRGVGESMPKIITFETQEEIQTLIEGFTTLLHHGNLTTVTDIDQYLALVPAFDQLFTAFDQFFVSKNGDNLKYIGTAAAVRDLVSMANTITSPQSDINYWGISYGTVIGYQLTQMFPDRVGKVILDGVLPPQDYTVYQPIFGYDAQFADVEAVYTIYLKACAAAGYPSCPFANPSTTTTTEEEVRKTMDQILQGAYEENPVNWAAAVSVLRENLYFPSSWPYLVDAWTGGGGSTKQPPPSPPFGIFPRQDPSFDGKYNIHLIWCSDSPDPSPTNLTTTEIIQEILRVSQTVTSKFGSIILPSWFCHKWSSRAVERYTAGPTWNIRPKNVVLVVGNMADPITPFRGAKLVASEMYLGERARLVYVAGPGHASISNNSTCTQSTIWGYMHGQIPVDVGTDEYDVRCEVETNIFGIPWNKTWEITPSADPDALTSGLNDPGLLAMMQARENGNSTTLDQGGSTNGSGSGGGMGVVGLGLGLGLVLVLVLVSLL